MQKLENKRNNFIGKFQSIRSAIISSYFPIVIVGLAVFGVIALRYTERTVLENAEESMIAQSEQSVEATMELLK